MRENNPQCPPLPGRDRVADMLSRVEETRVHRFHVWIALAVLVGAAAGLVVAGLH